MTSAITLPELPDVNDEGATKVVNFSEQANWVVPGFVMAGKSPAREKDVKGYIEKLVQKGKVTTYVCLQSEVIPQSEDTADMGGVQVGNEVKKLPSYAPMAKAVNPDAKFVYYGMRDDEAAPSEETLTLLIEDLADRVKNKGEVVYIHCKGGSGRTGIVAGCLLGYLYPSINADDVLTRIQRSFEWRVKGVRKWVNPKSKSPATEEQKEQVKRILANRKNDKPSAYKDDDVDESEDFCSPKNCSIM
jgi:protein-tyrosine phosphatase